MKLTMLTHDMINAQYRFYLFDTQNMERKFGFDLRNTKQNIEKRIISKGLISEEGNMNLPELESFIRSILVKNGINSKQDLSAF